MLYEVITLAMSPYLIIENSPSWARTNNPTVNSRVLYHWAIEENLKQKCNAFLQHISWISCNKIILSLKLINILKYNHNSLYNYLILSNHFTKTFTLNKSIHPFFETNHTRSSPRPISNSQLHALPHFHPCPIDLVVFKGSVITSYSIHYTKLYEVKYTVCP